MLKPYRRGPQPMLYKITFFRVEWIWETVKIENYMRGKSETFEIKRRLVPLRPFPYIVHEDSGQYERKTRKTWMLMDYDKTLEYWEELRKPLPGWCNRPAVIEDLIVIMFKIYPKYMYNKYTRMSIAWKKWWQYFY